MTTLTTLKSLYDDKFYNNQNDGALLSARAIIPILVEMVKLQTVVDYGCGRGAWLRACLENGVESIVGLDGPHVDQSKLLIDPANFRQTNFLESIMRPGRFDLAICLEVAEHLPPRAGKALIRALTESAPLVLFSAAIPGQGGTYHINERWPTYWREAFADLGYERLDPIRRHVWMDDRIEWWYRQNIYLYASAEAINASTPLQHELELGLNQVLELAHSDILERNDSLKGAWRTFRRAALAAVKRRLWPRK